MKRLIYILLLFPMICFAQANDFPEFKRSPQIFQENDRIWEVALDDLNGDGYLDAVFTSLGGSAQVLFNDGKGLFTDSRQTFVSGTHGIAIGDLDNDGDTDLFLLH